VALPLHATATLAFQFRQLSDHRFKFTGEDLQACPDAGYWYHLLGPSVGPLVPASPWEISYLFPYTRKSFSPATGLYSPSCRAFIPLSHASFFDEVWNVVSPTNLL
jgi:hypothetical protein